MSCSVVSTMPRSSAWQWRRGFVSPQNSGPVSSMAATRTSPTCSPSLIRWELENVLLYRDGTWSTCKFPKWKNDLCGSFWNTCSWGAFRLIAFFRLLHALHTCMRLNHLSTFVIILTCVHTAIHTPTHTHTHTHTAYLSGSHLLWAKWADHRHREVSGPVQPLREDSTPPWDTSQEWHHQQREMWAREHVGGRGGRHSCTFMGAYD